MCIEIPIEDFEPGDEHVVADLNLSLYGTRDAAQNWTREYAGFLESIGFRSGLASPCNFFHKQKRALLDSARRRLHSHWPKGGLELDSERNGEQI